MLRVHKIKLAPNEAALRKRYNPDEARRVPVGLGGHEVCPSASHQERRNAYKNFFDRLKRGKKGRDVGYPTFKKK